MTPRAWKAPEAFVAFNTMTVVVYFHFSCLACEARRENVARRKQRGQKCSGRERNADEVQWWFQNSRPCYPEVSRRIHFIENRLEVIDPSEYLEMTTPGVVKL